MREIKGLCIVQQYNFEEGKEKIKSQGNGSSILTEIKGLYIVQQYNVEEGK